MLGVLLFRDYGVSWDESVEHYYGVVNIKYIAKRFHLAASAGQPMPDLATYPDRDHGPAFDILVPIISRLFTSDTPRAYMLTRHLLIYSAFVLGVWSLYCLGRNRFNSWRFGLAGALALVLSPRLFAEGFYNGKDIVFLTLFALGMLFLTQLLERPTVTRAALLGVATGLAIDVRILGLLLVAFTLGMLALELFFRPRAEVPRWRWLAVGGVYLIAATVCTVAGWPYLWDAPLTNFWDAFQRLSRYPWLMSNFYLGQFVAGDQLPWHYAPVWILITTPLPYTCACVAGLVAWVSTWWQAGWVGLRSRENRLDLLFVGWLLGPILLVIVLRSVLYDGWRHLYFVYPALLLLALRGIYALCQAGQQRRTWRRVGIAAAVLASLEVGRTAVRMVLMHPHQQVYFSFLPPTMAERYFERDYWGLAYYQGLEWILAHEAKKHILISAPNPDPIDNNVLKLPEAQRQRIQFSPRHANQYQYFISGYRWHPQSYRDSVGQEVYSIRADGVKILSVFKKL